MYSSHCASYALRGGTVWWVKLFYALHFCIFQNLCALLLQICLFQFAQSWLTWLTIWCNAGLSSLNLINFWNLSWSNRAKFWIKIKKRKIVHPYGCEGTVLCQSRLSPRNSAKRGIICTVNSLVLLVPSESASGLWVVKWTVSICCHQGHGARGHFSLCETGVHWWCS